MKMMVFIFLLVLIYSRSIVAQDPCASPQALEQHLKERPAMQIFTNTYLSKLADRLRNFPFHPDLHRSAATVPVVVHVIYKSAAENISDSTILAEIDVLNDAFRSKNVAANNAIPAPFKPLAADTHIQFRLATRDQLGRPTTGITRKSTTKAYYDMVGEEAKLAPYGEFNWDPKRYLNIWVCDIRNKGNDGLFGYSSLPWDSIKLYDGIVMDYSCFGPGGVRGNHQRGMILVHETGHYFGLMHIWGDTTSCCCGDDSVSDTPVQMKPNYGAPVFPYSNGCPNGPNGDMFMNHMDYTNDKAKLMFTKGQRDRMLANLAPGGARASLAVSNGLFPANAVSRDYEVFLEPQNANLPSWKAALVMVHAWACQCSPALDNLLAQNKGKRGLKYDALGPEIADLVYALALTPEEMLACYPIEGFYNKLNRGPIALLSLAPNENYGLVISGMVIDQAKSRALLTIKDPMSIGPKGFFMINQKGAEYQVDYQEFMTEMLEQAVIKNQHIYFVFPPSTIPTL